MKIYVLVVTWEYEGASVLGVYSSKQAAEQARITYRESKGSIGDSQDILEYTLNAEAEWTW